MKATIDRNGCIACGICWGSCPEVFKEAEDSYKIVKQKFNMEIGRASCRERV